MSSTEAPRVFITHSWHDIDFARKLYDDLIAHGYQVWFDDKTLKVGHRMAEEINRALEWCEVYLPVLSPQALESPWCWEEINAAISLSNEKERAGRPRIIPILAQNCQVPAILRGRLYVNLATQYQTESARIYSAIDEYHVERQQKQREQIERERAAQLARQKAERERIAKVRAEEEQQAKEHSLAEKQAREKIEQEKIAKIRAEEERQTKERILAEKSAQKKTEQESRAKEHVQPERHTQEIAVIEDLSRNNARHEPRAQERLERDNLAIELTRLDIVQPQQTVPMTTSAKAKRLLYGTYVIQSVIAAILGPISIIVVIYVGNLMSYAFFNTDVLNSPVL